MLRRALRTSPLTWLVVLIGTLWTLGALFLWVAEARSNPEYGTLGQSFWNIAVCLFSGLDSGAPQTGPGKVAVVALLVLSAGIVGIFTAEIASLLVERRLGRKKAMPGYSLRGHFVICNWNEKAIPMIHELHAEAVKNKYPVVVVSDKVDAAALPEEDDDACFHEVYLVKGDPAQEVMLRRANVPEAYSVIILANREDGELADAKSILTAMAVRSVCEGAGVEKTHVCVEGVSPRNVMHLRRAGADEIVSESDFGMMLLAQTALSHGLSTVYRNLLTVSEETNEIYAVQIPPEYVGKTFSELGEAVFRANVARDNPAILLGLRNGQGYRMNPKQPGKHIIGKGDLAVVVAFERPESLL